MTSQEQVLIETTLYRALRAFHDCDDKEKRERYCKEYFDEFCEKTKVNPEEAYELLEKMFEQKRATSQFKYQYYDGTLKDILLGKENKKNKEDEGR